MLRFFVIVLVAVWNLVHSTLDHETTAGTLDVTEPQGLAPSGIIFVASYSKLPPVTPISLEVWVPDGDPEGCESTLPPAPSGRSVVAVLRRGHCTFLSKALSAQAAGAKALIVVFNSNDEMNILTIGSNASAEERADAAAVDIIVFGVDKSFGDKLINWNAAHPNEPAKISTAIYRAHTSLTDIFIVVFATTVVGLAAINANLHTGSGGAFARVQSEEVPEAEVASLYSGPMFVLGGSFFLVMLFFFMRFLVYVLIAGFGLLGFVSLMDLSGCGLRHFVPQTRRRITNVPLLGPVSVADVVCGVPALAWAISWIVLRNSTIGWLFQDVLGFCVILLIQEAIRIPDLKVGTLLLVCGFFFDIFWVFISPFFFGQSVMMSVATGGDTREAIPMVFRFPVFDDPFASLRILGFGDLALPGLLVSFLRRFDIQSGKYGCGGYFVWVIAGYAIGMTCVYLLMFLMKTGQPALLCLVPGTLIPTWILGAVRGEASSLWNGTPITVVASGVDADTKPPEKYTPVPNRSMCC